MNAIAKIGLQKAKWDMSKCCWDYDYIYYNSKTVHGRIWKIPVFQTIMETKQNRKNKKRNLF